MDAGGISKNLAQIWKHRVPHLRVERCGRVVVEIDSPHGQFRLSGESIFGPWVGCIRVSSQFPEPEDIAIQKRYVANPLGAFPGITFRHDDTGGASMFLG